MSLISEALKKAQAQQRAALPPSPGTIPETGAPMPPSSFGSAPPMAAPSGPSLGLLITFGAVFAIALLGGGALLTWGVLRALGPETAVSEPSTAARQEVAPAGAPLVADSSPPLDASLATPPTPATSLSPIAFKLEPETDIESPPDSPPVADHLPPSATAEEPTAVDPNLPAPSLPPPAARPEPEPPPTEPDPAHLAYVAQLEVRGVMTGGRKVLLYDPQIQRSRALAEGDLIGEAQVLHITAIEPHRLVFQDESGALYTKRY
ncbi:MAG: hypothetical protein ACLFR7_06775 [Opitutales bacterium]